MGIGLDAARAELRKVEALGLKSREAEASLVAEFVSRQVVAIRAATDRIRDRRGESLLGLTLPTQDGYDWPNGCTDERWPASEQHCKALMRNEKSPTAPDSGSTQWRGPATEYWRAMKALGEEL